MASYDVASAWYQAEGVNTKEKLVARAKLGLPPGIPADPSRTYSDEFKNGGWGRLLGTGRIANQNRTFVPYEDAAAWYQTEGVTSFATLQARAKLGLPPGIPADPNGHYPDFIARGGLTTFLGLKKMVGVSQIERVLRHVFETIFDEAQPHIGSMRVQGASGQQWQVDILLPKSHLIVEYDGSQYHYKSENQARDQRKTADLLAAGWSVVRLRGQGRLHALPLLRPKWDVSVDESLPMVERVGQALAQVRRLAARGALHLPATIDRRLQAWRPEHLDIKNIRNVLIAYDGFKSYDEASAWYRAEGVTSFTMMQARAKKGLPPGIPADPRNAYPDEIQNGGLGRFFGTKRVAPKNRVFLSYTEASAWCQAEGLTNQAEFRARAKHGLPAGIPTDPSKIYPEEFLNGGLGRFLNTGRIANKNRVFLSYSEAAAWYRAEGVTNFAGMQARAKLGLPPGIPSNPNLAYPEEYKNGGYGRFFGTGRPAPKNYVWVSYDEAAAWYQAEGVTSCATLRARVKLGLPAGVPADPRNAYPNEFRNGGLGRFLNTGRIAHQNRVFLSYKEAALWYQAEGVKSFSMLQERARKGLPPGIPANPYEAYPEEFKNGGLHRFLRTSHTKNQQINQPNIQKITERPAAPSTLIAPCSPRPRLR